METFINSINDEVFFDTFIICTQTALSLLCTNLYDFTDIVNNSGAVVASDFVWNLDDMFNAAMAISNFIALIGLSGLIVKISMNYYERKARSNVEPMLSAYAELIEDVKNGIGE